MRFDQDDAARCVRVVPSKIEIKCFLAFDVQVQADASMVLLTDGEKTSSLWKFSEA